jgi:hypothetical protein
MTVLEISSSVSSHAEMESAILTSNMRVIKVHEIFSGFRETLLDNQRVALH